MMMMTMIMTMILLLIECLYFDKSISSSMYCFDAWSAFDAYVYVDTSSFRDVQVYEDEDVVSIDCIYYRS